MRDVTDDPRFDIQAQMPQQGRDVPPGPYIQPPHAPAPSPAGWQQGAGQGGAQPYFVPVGVASQRNLMWRRLLIGAAIGATVVFFITLVILLSAEPAEPDIYGRTPEGPSSGDIFLYALAFAMLYGAIPGGLIGLAVHWAKRRNVPTVSRSVPPVMPGPLMNQGPPMNPSPQNQFGMWSPHDQRTVTDQGAPYRGSPMQVPPMQHPPNQGQPGPGWSGHS